MQRLLLALLLCISSFAHSESLSDKIRQDKVELMQDDSPAMQRAFKKAAEGLDEFLSKATTKPQLLTGFSVKIGLKEGPHTEYVWISNFSQQDLDFVGELNSQTEILKALKLGQRIEFKKSEIVDWMYFDFAKGRLVGNFTLCALLTQQPTAEADAVKRQYNIDCTGI